MEMLYSFWSDKILVGILKKVCCNNAVVSNILNVFFACFLLFSTLTVMNVHSIIKLLSHWKVTFGFELFYCMRNYSGVNSFVKFYIIHFSMISNVCWHQIKFFQAIDVIKYVVKSYWCNMWFWNVIDPVTFQILVRRTPWGLSLPIPCHQHIGGGGARAAAAGGAGQSAGLWGCWAVFSGCCQLEPPQGTRAGGPGATVAPGLDAAGPFLRAPQPRWLWRLRLWEAMGLGCWLVLGGRAGVQLVENGWRWADGVIAVLMRTWRKSPAGCCMQRASTWLYMLTRLSSLSCNQRNAFEMYRKRQLLQCVDVAITDAQNCGKFCPGVELWAFQEGGVFCLHVLGATRH